MVAVTNIAEPWGSVIGIGPGNLVHRGGQTNKSATQIVAGVAAMFLLAIVVDVVINLAGRLATPWERAPRGSPSAPLVASRSRRSAMTSGRRCPT